MLFIGTDAVADNLREASRRARAKPARGGTPNALFGRLSLADAPGAMAGLADRLTVLLPWGTLLAAVARPESIALGRLHALCAPAAEVRLVFGHDPVRDAAAALPRQDDDALVALCGHYLASGFDVRARRLAASEVAAIGTTWAAKLSRSSATRVFVEIAGRAGELP